MIHPDAPWFPTLSLLFILASNAALKSKCLGDSTKKGAVLIVPVSLVIEAQGVVRLREMKTEAKTEARSPRGKTLQIAPVGEQHLP